MKRTTTHALFATIAAGGFVLMTGCSSPKVAAKHEPLFYPAPPAAPRLQFLTSYAGSGDFDRPPGRWYDYIVGRVDEPRMELVKPYGVAMHGDRIYACDTVNRSVAVFDLAAGRATAWQPSGEGRLHTPINLAFDDAGTMYVADPSRGNVALYDAQTNFLGSLADAAGMKPTDVAVAGNRVYVADLQRAQIAVFDRTSRERLFTVPRNPTNAAERLFQPTNLAIDPQGRVVVCDSGAFCVKVFDPDGKLLHTFGEHGDGPGQFARPKGIAVDRAGRIYVVDAAMQVVQIFDADGQLLLCFGEPAGDEPGLDLPADVAIDYAHVDRFRALAAPGFALEYLVLVTNQYGGDKIGVYGFGHAL